MDVVCWFMLVPQFLDSNRERCFRWLYILDCTNEFHQLKNSNQGMYGHNQACL